MDSEPSSTQTGAHDISDDPPSSAIRLKWDPPVSNGEASGKAGANGIQTEIYQVWKIWRKTNPWRWRKDRQKSVMLTHFLLYLFLWLMLLSILFRRRKWDRILKQTKRYPDSGQERKQCSPLNKYVGINHSSLFFTGFLVLARWYL